MSEQDAVAVVAGVGPGLGAALCRRLVGAGYTAVGVSRSGAHDDALTRELGDAFKAQHCDVTDPDSVQDTFADIEDEIGPPAVLIYNAGGFLQKTFAETSAEEFLKAWAANCFGGFLCARDVVPGMLHRERGTIIFTGASASLSPKARSAAFGSAKFGLRGMAQSMARDLGPRGIHVAHVVIDGIIATPRTREMMPDLKEEDCLRPEGVAETYLQIIRQERSAWTHELDLRPDREPF